MATVCEVEQSLFAWAPRESAMDWDNVGHLVGDPEREVERILVALDITAVSYTHLDVYKRQARTRAAAGAVGFCCVGCDPWVCVCACLLYTSRCV